MIPEKALALAGPGAHLVARPRGRAHVYTGRLTSAGYVPRAGRPLCRVRTRRLAALERPPCSLRPVDERRPRVCARCSACLLCSLQGRQAEHPRTREQFRALYGDLTRADIAIALHLVETVDELDAAAHLSLALFGVAATREPFTEHGRSWRPLCDLIGHARQRLDIAVRASAEKHRDRVDDNRRRTQAARKAEIRQEREDRTDQYGFSLDRRRRR